MFDVGAYRYQCIDHSILDPYLKRWYVKWLYQYLPAWVPANLISLLGHFCIWLVFFFSATQAVTANQVWLCLLLLQFYLVLDLMDGMRARDTKTSSPLGEYIDHGGDTYNCGIFVYFSLHVLNVSTPSIFYILIFIGQIIFSLVSLEKKITGGCVFPKIGNIELQLFLIVFFAFLQIPSINRLLGGDCCGLSFATWILLCVAFLGAYLAIHSSLSRISLIPKSYGLFLVFSIILVLSLSFQASSCVLGSIVLILFMATYNGQLLFSHLTQRDIPGPDNIGSLLIVISGLTTILQWHNDQFFYLLLVYMVAKTLHVVINIFRYYSQFWLWTNPIMVAS